MAKKRSKGLEVSFSQTDIGADFEEFVSQWQSKPFHKDHPHIDLKLLWYALHNYSDNGGVYINWLSAGRQFYINNPKPYFKPNGYKPADQSLVESAQSNLDTAKRNVDRIFGRSGTDNSSGNSQRSGQ
jgi:hypothetical protein